MLARFIGVWLTVVQPVLTVPVPSVLVYCLCSVFSLYTSLFQVETRQSQTTLLCLSTTSLRCHILRHDAWRDQNGERRPAGAASAAVCSRRVHQ